MPFIRLGIGTIQVDTVNVQRSKNSKRSSILRWLGTLSAFGLLIYLIQSQGWDEIRIAFGEITRLHLFFTLILIFISRFAVVGRWYVLIRSVEDVTVWQILRLTFAGLFATNFLPTTVGGDVVRLAGAIQLNFDGAISAASLVVDRLIGMFGMFWALPFGGKPLMSWINMSGINPNGITLGFTFSWLAGLKEKTITSLRKVLQALKVWAVHPTSLVLAFLFTLVHMLSLFSIIMLLLNDMGDKLPLGVIAGLWSFVYFVTLIPISINGYGVQELSTAFIFSEIGGVSLQSGITISVLVRTLLIIGSLPGAMFLPGIISGLDSGQNTPE